MKTNILSNINSFAKRVIMVIAVVMMASSAWGMSTSDIESSAATTITDGAGYVIATAYNGYYLTTGVIGDWGLVSNSINDAAIFVAHGNASGFYLTCSAGTLVVSTSNSSFAAYDGGSTNNLLLGGSGEIRSINYASNSINLRSNTDSKFRWYNGTTGNAVYLYKVTTKYTVTYNAGAGTCKTSDTESTAGGGITLATATPSDACAAEGWAFAGWKQTSALTNTTTIPTLIPAGTLYHPHANETLYAVYKQGNIYAIDFESAANTYTNWTFTALSSQGYNAGVSAHGGTKIGITSNSNGAYSSLTTTSAIASPQKLRFYISKTSTNTTTSSWCVYTSSDGSTWGDAISTTDAKSMTKGTWVEVIVDLSSYSNVYVKIEYGTTNAPRAIDDVVLSCATYNSNPSCCATSVALSKSTQTNATISSFSPSSVTTCGTGENDRKVTITVAAATGYEFTSSARLGYSGDGTATYVSGPTGTGPYTFVYQFAKDDDGSGSFSVTSATAKTYTITYKDQGDVDFSGNQTSPPTTHTYGTATTLKIPTKFGHTFGGWFTASDCLSGAVGNASSAELGATDYTANITLYAKWTEKAVTNYRTNCGYSITYECNSASSGCPEDAEHAFYLPDPLPSAPTKSGCEFLGWYTDEELTIEAVAGATLSDDVTLYAKWCTSITTVSGKISVGSINETGGNASWSWTGATTGISKNILKVYNTSDVLVKTIDNISASATSQSITGLTPCTSYYATLTTVASSGYCDGEEQGQSDNFTTNGWAVNYTGGDATEGALLSNVTKTSGASQACLSENYVATFTANTGYELPATITVYIASSEVTAGGDYTWSISAGVGTLTVYTSELSEKIGVRIIGVAKEYTASNNLDKNGGSAHGQYTATYDATTIAINTAPTRTGYTIEGYYEESGCTNKVATATGELQANKTYTDGSSKWIATSAPTLYTKWSANIITITWNPNGDGASVTPTSSSYTYDGSTVDLPTPTRALHAFEGWYTEAEGGTEITEVGTTNKPTEDVEYFAHWRALTFEVKDQAGTGTADIHLTSTSGVTVYATSGCGNLITIKATNLDAISNLGSGTANMQNIQIKYLDANNGDAEVAKASSPFRLCNDGSSNYNVADGTNINLNGLTEYSQTFSISYTPNAYGQIDHYKLQLRLQNNNTEAMTITFDLYGRALPEEFVLAVKKDAQWYALPNTILDNERAITPLKITVNDATTPTAATYASNETVYKGTSRYASGTNVYGIRLTDPNDKWLQVSSSSGTNYVWVSGSGSSTCQDWWLSSSDFSSYTLKVPSSGAGDKSFGINNLGNIGFFASDATNLCKEVFLLPITNKYTDIAATAIEWGQHSVVLAANPGATADKAQARIDDGSPTADQTITAINAAIGTAKNVKVPLGDIDLDVSEGNEGKLLYIDWYNGSTLLGTSCVTIPRIVAEDRTANKTNDTDKKVWNTEVHVLPGATLTIDGESFKTGVINSTVSVNELQVYPGATINVSTGTLAASTLRLRNGWTRAGTKAYDVARVYIADDAALTKGTASMDYNIYELADGQHFYPLAVPFPVAVSAIDYADSWLAGYSTYGMSGQYVIKEYNGARRAEKGPDQANNWTPLAEDATLSPGKGYIIAAVPVYGEAIIRVPLTYNDAWTADGELGTAHYDDADNTKNVVSVEAYAKAEGETKKVNKGWNLLGVPFMSCYGTSADMGTDGVVMQGKFDFKTGDWKEEAVRYVNVPVHDFSEYIQVDMEDDDPVTVLRPGWCFFVQVEEDGDLTFLTADQAASSDLPIYAPKRGVKADMPTVKTGIILSDGEKSDKTTFLVSDKYSATEYEINADLEKMFGNGYTLATYSLSGATRLAYNAMSNADASNLIPIGYRAPADGEYTFSINPRYAQSGAFESVNLIDYETGIVTDLLQYSYSFSTARTQNDSRFAINVVKQKETPTDIENIQGDELQGTNVRKLLIDGKVYIIRGGQMYDATGKKVKGGAQ